MKKNIHTDTHIKGKRSQGFLKKMSSKGGRKTLSRRRRKGRKKLCN
jgi:ribosomal protein L34